MLGDLVLFAPEMILLSGNDLIRSIPLFLQKYFSFFQKYFSFFSKVFLFFGKIFSERVKAGGRLVVFDYDLKYKLKNSHN